MKFTNAETRMRDESLTILKQQVKVKSLASTTHLNINESSVLFLNAVYIQAERHLKGFVRVHTRIQGDPESLHLHY